MSNTLLVCEKPDAAKRVAEALSDGKPERFLKHGMSYYSISHNMERIIVCSALGHLYTVSPKTGTRRGSYPVWDLEWKPKHMVEREEKRIGLWIQAINELSKQSDGFVNACDYDLEGSLIGYMILKYACEGAESKAKRMKFSTLTRNDLRSAYLHLAPNLDFNTVYAAICRHEIDWLYGINLSRALTTSTNKYGDGYVALSTGRVQGPTLRFVVEREKEIQKFVPEPYWTIDATIRINEEDFPAQYHIQKLPNASLAKGVVDTCLKKIGVVTDVKTSEVQSSPPHPFDLSTLQSEAYRLFGFSPRDTLRVAERLYLDTLISYPRTSSQKLPASIGYREILNGLTKFNTYSEKCRKLLGNSRLMPFEGPGTDPAHPAVYPTGATSVAALDNRARRVFDLIVKRFMATFAPAAVRRSERAIITHESHVFYVRGFQILEPGWIEFYAPYARFDEAKLPPMSIGQEVLFQNVISIERFTQPPSRYNPGSLLRLMEDQEIGTKATRAEIVDTLYKRCYVKEERMIASGLAFDVVELMLKYCPKIVDVGFTRELEQKMQEIELGNTTREEVVQEAAKALKPAIEELKTNESEIGRILSRSARLAALSLRMLASPCPDCGSELYIQTSRTTGKRFITCSHVRKLECKFTLPLPQLGRLTLLAENCPKCGFQLVRTWSRGRRPLVSCSRCYATNIQKSPRNRAFIDVHDKTRGS